MMQLITGNVNCQPVSTVKGDILSSLDLWTFMRIVFWCCWEENLSSCARKHHFLILRGRVLTRARWSVRHFGYMRHIIHFWLVWYKNYRNWSRFGKVVAKSLLPHFYGPHCSYCGHSLSSHVCVAAVLLILLNYTKFIVIFSHIFWTLFLVNLSVWLHYYFVIWFLFEYGGTQVIVHCVL